MKVVDYANSILNYNEDPTSEINSYQRVNEANDFLINVGEDIYGIFNSLQNTIGYDGTNNINISSDKVHSFNSEMTNINTNEFHVNTDPYGFRWNGLCLNPELLGTSPTILSEKMINNLININNNTAGISSVDETDIKSLDIFTIDKSRDKYIHEQIKKYPILTGLKYKNDISYRERKDLTNLPNMKVFSPEVA